MPCDNVKTSSDIFRCTVVIVNWNSWDILSCCLEKLQQQTFQNFNVMVIDNASDLPAPSELISRYPNIRFIQNQANLGFAAANNQAINLSDDTEWVVLLNPDAFAEPDWLEHLIDAARKNPDYAMFASRQLMDGNQNLLDGDGDVYHISGLVWRAGHGMPVEEAAHEPREIFSPCAAAALYCKDALVSVGGFDEDFFCYVEDVDLGFRLRLMGHRCLLVPSAIVHHMGSATTGGQRSDFSVYHGHRNLVWTYVKNMPGWLFWLFLPLHVAMNLVTICVFSVRGQGLLILKAKRDALLGLPKMWRKRQHIQKVRLASNSEIWRQLDKRIATIKPGKK
jgi:GT2 family glycosyltransferase